MDSFMFAAGILGIRIAQINLPAALIDTFTRTAEIMEVDVTGTRIVTGRAAL